ncbi:stringent starvation protein B [Leptospira perolatii]|uniref:Stringent starvation protein B n=1 Tax=Leptospira perolatii TaxID=2023191 RepID=A0A2M9ZPH8_9LEPT|nr:ClpXP protease specificity-enhancing factor SspB [Leptospira perolatii]PJZ70621.1 stringent starvation protein B [Leptospira perolatii]PJZ73833.1 stringent starvation protein B [Leptospira perolatii]
MDSNLEEVRNLRELKKQLFSLYWERFGTFYLHAMPHPDLKIGNRGLVGEEAESGIVLVIGPRAARDIRLEEEFVYAELQFGYAWEHVYIPWDGIFRFFDKSQQTVSQMKIYLAKIPASGSGTQEIKTDEEPPVSVSGELQSKNKKRKSNVIQVDFGSKTKK